MPRNTNKTPPPVELVNATYDDVINKFIKKFDLPPQIAATIIISLRDRYSRMAIHLALDSALCFAKENPNNVVINQPPPPPPSSSELPDQRTTHYVG